MTNENAKREMLLSQRSPLSSISFFIVVAQDDPATTAMQIQRSFADPGTPETT